MKDHLAPKRNARLREEPGVQQIKNRPGSACDDAWITGREGDFGQRGLFGERGLDEGPSFSVRHRCLQRRVKRKRQPSLRGTRIAYQARLTPRQIVMLVTVIS